MLKSHEKFHSANGKRLVLVAEDDEIDRELLGNILKEEYEVLFAADGLEALRIIQEHQTTLSVVLLDLQMPGINGLDLLEKLKDDQALQLIPVVVMTSDQESEIKSLTLGAADFIPKPYPTAGVILARLRRTIELFEDRLTIQTTERDPLTNLYNREFFYHYAELFDQYHESMEMDAIVIDIYHFRVINERFGNAYGDEVLRRIGLKVREMVSDTGGIVCRREADTFMVYCPHGKNYKKILESASYGLSGDDVPVNRIRLRMGVYAKVDRSIPIERRFDRAKMAVDMIRNSYTKTIEFYDHKLHEKEVFEQQLVEGFHQGLEEKQFKVYYQPKFDVRPDKPVLASAEALIRWDHPHFGFISPGQFIPLFEDNGLIQELDIYVWNTVAEQLREWKKRFGYTIPVSVNVSRVDMYDPHLVDTFQKILISHDLEPNDLPLEVTESAYTQDSEQIIATVDYLRQCGFHIEMDDFGNGYSSLNMLSTLPIDALKLDMDFVQNAFKKRNDTRMLEIIIDIADYLTVPVIAEGVETEDQLEALKAIGCDIVQGFYFSRPVPPDQFEKFLIERIKLGEKVDVEGRTLSTPEKRNNAFGRIANALSSSYETIYYVDLNNDHYVEFSTEGQREELKIDKSGKDFFTDITNTIHKLIHPDDQAEVIRCLQKDVLPLELEGTQPFSLTYRMILNGEPVYYNLKAVRALNHDHHHIVIGISNVDHEIKTSGAFEMIHPNAVNFNGLAHALSIDMETIYYVDIQSDTYLEFKADTEHPSVPMEMTGRNFFKEFRKNLLRVIYEADRDKINNALDKDILQDTLHHHKVFAMLYRIVVAGAPVYYRMKVVQANGEDNRHIIVGISNVNDQITEEEKQETNFQDVVTFAGIAKALAQDYFSIYVVDTRSDHFYEYSSDDSYQNLGIERRGEDFFNFIRGNAESVVYTEDLPRFLNSFTKANVIRTIQTNHIFTMTYRLLINQEPTYVCMKISPLGDAHSSQVVVGINNIQAGMERHGQLLPNSSLSRALAGPYFCIYYLDVDTDDYVVFTESEDHDGLNVEKNGSNFFGYITKMIAEQIHPDDREHFLTSFTRDNFYTRIAGGKPVLETFRMREDERWVYVQMKAMASDSPDDSHVIIGLTNVDEQLRQEEEHIEAIRMAHLDELTGVKSNKVYLEDEKRIDEGIQKGSAEPFGLVICGLHNLRDINDTFGENEGDEIIKQAGQMLTNVYKHSPIYRVSGDQFAVILRHDDYENREHLFKMITSLNNSLPVGRKAVMTSGMAVYDSRTDSSFADVSRRAESAMRENKNQLKQGDK